MLMSMSTSVKFYRPIVLQLANCLHYIERRTEAAVISSKTKQYTRYLASWRCLEVAVA